MTVSLTRHGAFAVVCVDHPPVNALSQAVRQGLWEMVGTLEALDDVTAVILICAGRTFMAGADVSEFGKPPMEPHLRDLVTRIEAARKPWIAAMHGSALGGGFEIALACRYRVALATASVGLPEVNLGIIPGAGGTVRTPRFAGIEAAVELVTTGKPVRAPKAKQMGLIDAVIEGDLLEGSLAFAHACDLANVPALAQDRPIAPVGPEFWTNAEAALVKRVRGETAPLRALACVKVASERSFTDALAFERETFLELRGSPQASAMRYVFFCERAAPRPSELNGVTPRPVRTVGVIGSGAMGAGIAAACRDAGLPVILIEQDQSALERGFANLLHIDDGAVTGGRISAQQAADKVNGVIGQTDLTALAEADLVIEAVFEDLAVKRDVFARLATHCRSDAILATNTSYVDPQQIFEGLTHPERFLGLHFFSPAQVMKLLEIIPTAQTDPNVLSAGFALARAMNKIPVRAGLCDGFIGNRMLKVLRAQAERVLLSGATPVQVDAAMRVFGQPMGPFEAQDLGGLDSADFQRKAARARGDTVFAPLAERLVALGRLGQKTKAGWYDYPEGSREGQASLVVTNVIKEAVEEALIPQRTWSPSQIVDALLLPVVNEGARLLAEGIAMRASDIDLVNIHGCGFPRWLGGPMHWAQAEGLADVVARLETLAAEGLADPVCDGLRERSRTGEGF